MTRLQVLTQSITTDGVIQITPDQLLEHLFDVRGATFVQVWRRTQSDKMKVASPYWNRTEKISRVVKDVCANIALGCEYKNVVNNARIREVEAAAKECGIDKETLKSFKEKYESLPENLTDGVFIKEFEKKENWFKHSLNPFTENISRIVVQHKTKEDGQRYIMEWVLRVDSSVYRWADTLEPLTEQEVVEYKSYFYPKKSNAGHQGLSKKNEVYIRTVNIENVRRIRLNQNLYQIV